MTVIVLVISFIGFFICLSVHEAAHAYMSLKLGDPTAKLEGRLSLNPLAHIDLIGTIVVPLFLIFSGLPAFGWAKPVMINPRNFSMPRRDNFLTALAGPVSNLLFGVLLGLIVRFVPLPEIVSSFLALLVSINILLAAFNLLPIPPLDGSKIWGLFLSDESYYMLERMGPFILLAVIVFSYSSGFSIFGWVSTLTNLIVG